MIMFVFYSELSSVRKSWWADTSIDYYDQTSLFFGFDILFFRNRYSLRQWGINKRGYLIK